LQGGKAVEGLAEHLRALAVGPPQGALPDPGVIAENLERNGDDTG
jgi:hypothetical protein